MVGIHYALLSLKPFESGFKDVTDAVAWIDGPLALLESTDSLSIRRGDHGDIMLRMVDLTPGGCSAQYAAAVLFRLDLENIESAALAFEVLVAVLDQHSYDVWNAAYPPRTIAKCAELRPLNLQNTQGYVMRPPEFECLATRVPE